MTVKEFIELLKQFPQDAKVVLYGEEGSDGVYPDSIKLEIMDYVKIFPGFEPYGYVWAYQNENKKEVIITEKVVLIK